MKRCPSSQSGGWKSECLEAGKTALAAGKSGRSSREEQLEAQVTELTQALGEAAVAIRVWKRPRAGPAGPFAELEVIGVQAGMRPRGSADCSTCPSARGDAGMPARDRHPSRSAISTGNEDGRSAHPQRRATLYPTSRGTAGSTAAPLDRRGVAPTATPRMSEAVAHEPQRSTKKLVRVGACPVIEEARRAAT